MPRKINRRQAERRGRRAEWLAALTLILKGYRILALRARLPGGEIDLIALKRNTLVFIEVKARAHPNQALEAVGRGAQTRITRAANQWVARRPSFAHYGQRFDVIGVIPRRWPLHWRDAWRP